MKQVIGPSGHRYFIRPDGRKTDEDGFVCATPTPGNSNPYWFCVSVKITDSAVMVRDTKDPAKTTLTYSREEWDAFIKGVKNGEFDL